MNFGSGRLLLTLSRINLNPLGTEAARLVYTASPPVDSLQDRSDLRTALDLPEGVPGIIMSIHTFGEYLDQE